MYYKKAKENFSFNSTVNYKPVNTEKFPVWALILLVSLIALIIGLILYYTTFYKNPNFLLYVLLTEKKIQ